MSLTLHQAFVPQCRQLLIGLRSLIDKGEAHAREHGLSDAEMFDASLIEGMWTLPWHVRACWMHSGYALEQVPTGEFTPDFTNVPSDWDSMRAMVDDALSMIGEVSPNELEAIASQTTGFVLGGKRLMEMTAQNFLLSFNQPNFYFHATTFYDILRAKGVALGKMDFMGPLPVLGR